MARLGKRYLRWFSRASVIYCFPETPLRKPRWFQFAKQEFAARPRYFMHARRTMAILSFGIFLSTGIVTAQSQRLGNRCFREKNWRRKTLARCPLVSAKHTLYGDRRCPDPADLLLPLELYRSHIREIGAQGTTVLEFLDDVPWAMEPYTDLNDSRPFTS